LHNKPLKVGITGIFGSGKTTVSLMFEKEGIPVISCDEIVHRVLRKKKIIREIKSALGNSVFEKGILSRKKIARIVFEEEAKRENLEGILHPEVFREIERKIFDCGKKNDIIVIEIPLLFETKSEKLFDITIVVSSTLAKIKERLKAKFHEDEILERWNNQIALKEKERKADYVIHNSGSYCKTLQQVRNLIERLKREI